MERVVIVCDLPDHHLRNRIFTKETQKAFPWGESFWPILKTLVENNGWEIVTSDIYLDGAKQKYSDYHAFVISYMQTPMTSKLFDTKATPLIVYSLESPNVALRFYAAIRSIASQYSHSVLFRGAARVITGATESHVLYWPNTTKKVLENKGWEERGFLCMIASNKNQFATSRDDSFALIRSVRRRLALPVMRMIVPHLKTKDQYSLRLQAINYFSSKGLALFGTGWHEQRSLSKKLYQKIKQLKARRVDDKIQTLKDFKYCICFENCRFPGYLTEKIFDCFFAGVVPIYMGAPDIEDFVPKNCFIHFEDYKSFPELHKYLLSISRERHQEYLVAARAFLASEDFNKFTDTHMAQVFFEIIQEKCTDLSTGT